MNHHRAWPLATARLLYASLGIGTSTAGVIVLQGGDPGLAVLLATAGVLAMAAAAWVTSEHRGRAAVASIGIVVGPLPAAGFAFLVGSFLAAFGPPQLAAVAVGVIAVCVTMMALMWRASRRPWEDPQPAAR